MDAGEIAVIECFWAPTPNSRRVTMMLEECGIAYERRIIDLRAGEQESDWFLALNPAGAVPVIRDPQGPDGRPLVLSQSGAICLYLAERSGCLLPAKGRERAETLQWLAWALSDLSGAATALYRIEAGGYKNSSTMRLMEDRMGRTLAVLDRRLQGRDMMTGPLSIADIATYPIIITSFVKEVLDRMDRLRDLRRWLDTMSERPSLQRGL